MTPPPAIRDAPSLATVRQRTLAYVIDLCLVGAAVFASVHDRERSRAREITSFLARSVAVGTLYHVLLEGIWGRTAGKAVVDVEVIRTDGSPCTLRAAIVRTAARAIDALPLGYALGLGSIAVTRRRQRIGDLLADTIVVEVRRGREADDLGGPSNPDSPER